LCGAHFAVLILLRKGDEGAYYTKLELELKLEAARSYEVAIVKDTEALLDRSRGKYLANL
jgi:hypothetical protein